MGLGGSGDSNYQGANYYLKFWVGFMVSMHIPASCTHQ